MPDMSNVRRHHVAMLETRRIGVHKPTDLTIRVVELPGHQVALTFEGDVRPDDLALIVPAVADAVALLRDEPVRSVLLDAVAYIADRDVLEGVEGASHDA